MSLRFFLLLLHLLLSLSPCGPSKTPFFLLTGPKALLPGAEHNFFVTAPLRGGLARLSSPFGKAQALLQHGSAVLRLSLPRRVGNRTSVPLRLRLFAPHCAVPRCRALRTHRFRLRLRDPPALLAIETSAPVYRPGSELHFRLLPLDLWSLRPSAGAIEEVFLESPSRLRMAHWGRMTWAKALAGFRFPFSEDAEQGRWTVVAVAADWRKRRRRWRRRFHVERFRRPRFRVTLRPPRGVFAGAAAVTAAVCAEFENGAPLSRAEISAELCIRSSFFLHTRLVRPCAKFHQTLAAPERCAEFSAAASAIQLRNASFLAWGQRFVLSAKVTEAATNITLTHTAFGGRLERRQFRLESSAPRYFSTGLPFRGELRARNFDGSPRTDAELIVRVLTSWRALGSLWGFEERFRADSAGRITLAIPPFPRGKSHVEVSVTVAKPQLNEASAPGKLWLFNPKLHLFLSEVHSASGIGLQVLPPSAKNLCRDGKFSFRLQSNVPLHNKALHVLVSARNAIRTKHDFGPIAAKDCCRDTDQRDVGHFTCVRTASACSQKIRCLPGWSGINCASPFCASGCLRGACVRPGRCRCDRGWAGPACERCVPRRGCRNGFCRRGNDCNCLTGYTGYLCDRTAASVWVPSQSGAPFQPFQLPVPRPEPGGEQRLHIFEREVKLVTSSDLFPSAYLTVIMVITEGNRTEVVSASADLPDTSACLSTWNPTSFSFAKSIARPGDTLSATLSSSSGNRLCALSVVDSVLDSFGDRGVLSADFLARSVKDWLRAARRQTHVDPALRSRCPAVPSPDFRFWGGRADASWAFRRAGLFVLSSAKTATAPCEKPHTRRGGGREEEQEEELKTRVRSFFPDSWLFTLLRNPPQTFPLRVPDSLTAWRADFLCVTSRGLGISPPAVLKVSQPLQLSVVRPVALIRGEVARLVVNVLSVQNACAEVSVTVRSNSSQLQLLSFPSNASCVCRFGQFSFPVFVRAAAIGIANFSASALSQPSSACGPASGASAADALLLSLRVEPEGVPQTIYRGELLCPRPGAAATFSAPSPDPRGSLVAGSLRRYLGWSGSVLGPATKHLGDLLRLPTGCGEQNMAAMVPSIAVLDFLKRSGREEQQQEVVQRAKTFIEIGFQRQLRFLHRDGSFSAFGPGSGSGSTWLTAFVLKSFLQASRHVTLPPQILRRALAFLLGQQQRRTGCFREDGAVFSSLLLGASGRGPNHAAVTAFVFSALLPARNASASAAISASLSAAARCLSSPQTNLTTFSFALRAFAMTSWRPSSPQAVRLREELQRRVRRSRHFQFWTARPGPAPAGLQWDRFTAEDVETTAYALLTRLAAGPAGGPLLPVARWLAALQSDHGGWFSTQDTAVAFSALAAFSVNRARTRPYLRVEVRSASRDSLYISRRVTPRNELLFRQLRLPPGENVTLVARGRGCLLVNSATFFNLRRPPQDSSAFRLAIRVRPEANCSRVALQLCVRGAAAMAAMIVRLPSGWGPAMPLQEGNEAIPSFQAHPGGFTALLRHLSAAPVCAKLVLREEVAVRKAGPMRVELVDYYSPADKLVKLRRLCPGR